MISEKYVTEVSSKYELETTEEKIFRMMLKYQEISRANGKYTTLFKKDTDPREAKHWKAFQNDVFLDDFVKKNGNRL